MSFMKAILLFFLFLCLPLLTQGQTFFITQGDTLYQQREYPKEELGIWIFRDSLPKGTYFAVRKLSCGLDTLARAEFITDGVKHGRWFYRGKGFCDRVDYSKPLDSARFVIKNISEKWEETTYEAGYLVKRSKSFHPSGSPMLLYSFPENATQTQEWNLLEYYDERGNLRESRDKRTGSGWYEKAYYENGQLQLEGPMYDKSIKKFSWKYYYENGVMKAKGKKATFEDEEWDLGLVLRTGKWLYWDNKGKLIAKGWFKKGELVKSKVSKKTAMTFEEIDKSLERRRQLR